MKHGLIAALLTTLSVAAGQAAGPSARDMYTRAMAQERVVRDASTKPTLAQMRRVVASYEQIVRKHPSSAYCDNALWQGGTLAMLTYEKFGDDADRQTAARLFAWLKKEYPASRLARQARTALPTSTAPAVPSPTATATPSAPPPVAPVAPPVTTQKSRSDPVATLTRIRRTAVADGVRLTVDLDAEVAYHQEEIANPRRLFFDFKGAKAAPGLQDLALKFDEDLVKEVRLGRHPQNTTRVVIDIEGVAGYSVYPMYGPYRLVVDLRRASATPGAAPPGPAPFAPVVTPPSLPVESKIPAAGVSLPGPKAPAPEPKPVINPPLPAPPAADVAPLPSKPAVPKSLPPVAPAANSNGKFSLSRQLGLGVSRIVIDAGHGGHDPGARANGVSEAELTLDVALRLQKLLEKQPGVEVVMTRDTDEFIPLQERTAIANREGADLFLSIHANASRNPQARGIETYFLNFAMNPEAEAVAARENAGSGGAMHSLPDIVKAIALNNKINESRDFAATVQHSMVKRLSARNRSLRDLGVKQAPFVVLIGAGMPSVLAEISFVTNKQDGAMLKIQNYRQLIAQALLDAILNYQQGLKRMNAVASKKATY